MSYRKYDHNVDIKSTQLTRGLKSIGNLILYAAGGAVVVFILLVINGLIMMNLQQNERNREKENAINITSYKVMEEIASDLRNNKARYDVDWSGKWVTIRGNISGFSSQQAFEINNQSSRWAIVTCYWSSVQREKVARLDAGDIVNVVGELSVTKPFYEGNKYKFGLSSCEIL